MLPVLHLDPVLGAASLIRAIPTLRYQPLKAHLARGPKQIRSDLATLERIDEDALGPTRQQPFKVGLAHR